MPGPLAGAQADVVLQICSLFEVVDVLIVYVYHSISFS